jgi:SAM-dependent methyltransferase
MKSRISQNRLETALVVDNLDELLSSCTQKRQPFYDTALKYCTPGLRVLDIGSGDGSFAQQVRQCEVHVLDGNAETVRQLRTAFDFAHEHRLPAPLPFDDVFFDVIHCSHLVEHLEPQDVYSLLEEIDRCLKPGGVFVVSAPLLWTGFYNDLSHVRPYPPTVFIKYMGHGGRNRTRQQISVSYCCEEIKYRFSLRPINYYNLSTNRRWVKVLLFHVVGWLRRIRFAAYEASGFTLVLRKRHQNETRNEDASRQEHLCRT